MRSSIGGKHAAHNAELTAAHPTSIFAIRSLLYPVCGVLTLGVATLTWGEPLDGLNFLIGVLTFVLLANVLGTARLSAHPSDPLRLGVLRRVAQRWLMIVLFLAALLYVSRLTEQLNLAMYGACVLAIPLVLWGAHVASERLLIHQNSKHAAPRRGVIVGVTELGARLESSLEHDALLRTEVLGFFDDRNASRLPTRYAHRVLGGISRLAGYAATHDVTAVYVTLPIIRSPRIQDLLTELHNSTVSIYFVPDMAAFDLMQARLDLVGGIPVVAVRESPFYGARAIAKRLSDIVVASALLVACLPLLLFVAAGVRLSSPGPILFKQRRYGLDGHEIRVFKFRSMTVMEDGAATYTQVTQNDVRVTPFGAVIRKLSLDELPQLFNVLAGHLSMVGPRPHAIAVNEQYRKLIPGYMVRHKVRPGITGWAQINGYRGGDDLESMQKRIEYDLDYLRNWSLSLDLSIMVRTAMVVWNDRSAY